MNGNRVGGEGPRDRVRTPDDVLECIADNSAAV
jgi:hypothetical protein